MCERGGVNFSAWRNKPQLLRLEGFIDPKTREVSLINRQNLSLNGKNGASSESTKPDVESENHSEVIVYSAESANVSVSKIS